MSGPSGASLLAPLFSFNLGVKLGWVAVSALLLAVLWKLRDLPAFKKHETKVATAASESDGGYWFVTHLLF